MKKKCDRINQHQKVNFENSELDPRFKKEQSARERSIKRSLKQKLDVLKSPGNSKLIRSKYSILSFKNVESFMGGISKK